jgi:hypothetical protein
MGRTIAENVKVVVRVRPMTTKETNNCEDELVRCVSDRSVQVIDPAQQQKGGRAQTGLAYQFERCFGQTTTQEELFENCGVKDLLDHVLEGFSGLYRMKIVNIYAQNLREEVSSVAFETNIYVVFYRATLYANT